jgi:hypothetical protein
MSSTQTHHARGRLNAPARLLACIAILLMCGLSVGCSCDGQMKKFDLLVELDPAATAGSDRSPEAENAPAARSPNEAGTGIARLARNVIRNRMPAP